MMKDSVSSKRVSFRKPYRNLKSAIFAKSMGEKYEVLPGKKKKSYFDQIKRRHSRLFLIGIKRSLFCGEKCQSRCQFDIAGHYLHLFTREEGWETFMVSLLKKVPIRFCDEDEKKEEKSHNRFHTVWKFDNFSAKPHSHIVFVKSIFDLDTT